MIIPKLKCLVLYATDNYFLCVSEYTFPLLVNVRYEGIDRKLQQFKIGHQIFKLILITPNEYTGNVNRMKKH